MNDYEYKLNNHLFPLIEKINNPIILELGVQSGRSTKRFLDICKKNNGKLYSIDIDDCSEVSKDRNWSFFKTRDDNFEFIKSKIPKNIDVLFIDTLHEAKHVEKIIYGYYDLIKVGGYIFIDDISHLPYLSENSKNNFYCEINNKETFQKILEIYYYNQSKFDLNFSFISSGLAVLKKKDNFLETIKKLKSRETSFKNLIRKLWLKIKN
jgi:predicted O-methyltransferase YrrM|tara:strand:+ start:6286 stop:6912 length:627 start_codon:yes stop_codon:yes gene_type:complete